MSASRFGNRFVITTFGESHGAAMGVVIDGCPAGVFFDEKLLISELDKRKPGVSQITSGRKEADVYEVLSGVFEGITLGTPIAIIVRNRDTKSEDYNDLKSNFRAGHADDVWQNKFGIRDHRGGGRSSGRETISRVIAGSVAHMVLNDFGIKLNVSSFAKQIGPVNLNENESVFDNREVQELLLKAKEDGRSYGGIAEVIVENLPANLGQPVFHKLKADLASAYMGIGATIGVEFGEGFEATKEEGSKWHYEGQSGYGGIRGGISTGEKINVRVAFKPTSSVLDVARKGRHDPCIVPRALPVLEAMTYLVLVDHVLWSRTDRR
ncbi:MAG: chorismate synthase [Proteobacteria bacterium SG_bin7]|nr:MAG: chorismate synthase [Proteobacteria bacterium SG_bin7]